MQLDEVMTQFTQRSSSKLCREAKSDTSGKVLFVCYGGGHAATIVPVVEALKREGVVPFTVLGLTTARSQFESRGIPVYGFRDLLEATDQRSRDYGQRILADVSGSTVGVSEDESIAYLGQCMKDLVDELGESAAWQTYHDRGRHAFSPLATMRRAISAFAPTLVVTTNSPKSERAAILAAQQLGVRTLMIPDMFCEPAWEAYHPLQANHFAVFSLLSRRNLIKLHHVSHCDITVTGQPAFDKSAVPGREKSLQYVAQLAGRELRDYIVLATSPDIPDATYLPHGSADSLVAVRAIIESLRGSRNRPQLVLKPHPSESEQEYHALCDGEESITVLPARADLNQLLRGATAMIAASPTTAVIDALVFGVPCIAMSLRRPNLRDVLPWDDLGIAVLRKPEELTQALSHAMLNSKTSLGQSEVSREFQLVCTGAATRIATLARKMAECQIAELTGVAL